MALKQLLEVLGHLLREVPSSFPRLFHLLLARCRRRTQSEPATCCLPIPSGVWLQPDAYLYSQRYLMSLGMAVTWDNPDVSLTDMGGVAIGSHDLQPSTEYRITALIHNRSATAPAPGLPVVFTLIAFGVGGPTRQTIGVVRIDLPVRAAPGEPAPASIVWRTPSAPDHYCVEIDAAWPDDAFPIDNVGQHNTVVKSAAPGEQLRLTVPVYGPVRGSRMRLQLDSYALPDRPLVRGRTETRQGLMQRVVAASRSGHFEPDPGWGARLSAAEIVFEGEMAVVELEARVPADAVAGNSQRFNISATDAQSGAPVGGVTAIVQVS